jgi:hypothetical protein
MSNPVQVDNYLRTESSALNAASAELKAISRELDEQLQGLGNLGRNILTSQVSGPPSALLGEVWDYFWDKTTPLKERIDRLADNYVKQAQEFIDKYKGQVAAAEKQAKDAADAVEAAKKAAQDAQQ